MNKYIYLAEPSGIAQEAINLLNQSGYQVYSSLLEVDLNHLAQGIFVRTYVKLTATFLSQFPKLRFILKAGVGLDNIDTTYCKDHEIVVFNSPASNSNAVAEYIVATALSESRNLDTHKNYLNNGMWRSYEHMGSELENKTIGLAGCGSIGKEVARKLGSFGVNILGYDPYISESDLKAFGIKKMELDSLLANSDIVSVQIPLNQSTQNLFNLAKFKLMKPSSIFINISRGELVDEDALLTALNRGYIKRAVLDVFCNEPNINQRLLNHPQVVATPHVAGFTKESHIRMSLLAVENMLTHYRKNGDL